LTPVTLAKPETGFEKLSLSPRTLAALQRISYFEPTPVQVAVIPYGLSGRDVIGQAQTGTGKTAAFLVPFLDSWRDTTVPGPQALVLAPTRELVVQKRAGSRRPLASVLLPSMAGNASASS
jgi:ATP-dependent RNA helicase DeaD